MRILNSRSGSWSLNDFWSVFGKNMSNYNFASSHLSRYKLYSVWVDRGWSNAFERDFDIVISTSSGTIKL